MSIRIMLVDDYRLFRQGLREVLEAECGLEVVAEADSGEEAVKLAPVVQPDIIILDISMPGMDGVEAARRLRETVPASRVLMVTIQATSEHLYRAGQAGAYGYILKDTAANEVITAVKTIAAGRPYRNPLVADLEPLGSGGALPPVGPLESLTDRERAVLIQLVNGRTNQEAARAIGISERTVEIARTTLMNKLRVHNIPTLVKFALVHGLTTLD
jgi:DNA-binding NarL/FixJ family response regulator